MDATITCTKIDDYCPIKGVHSSAVEHLTADQEVTGSNPVGPFIFSNFLPCVEAKYYPIQTTNINFYFTSTCI